MNCNNYFDMTDQGDSFETWQGLRGPYYTPHVAADGVLSWTNTGNLPNPAPVDISGPPGSGVELRGPVATVYDLPVTAPASELWQVGTQAPYNGYFFNGTSWVNLGPVAAGTTFTPAVSSDGVISWTNDGGLPNPESVNIKGPQGATGATGADGVSPEVTIAQISGGHSVTITDADHPQGQQFDVLDGQTGATGPAGPGVPAGGSSGRVLKKQSATDYDAAWETEDLGITGASVDDLVRISAVSNGTPTAFAKVPINEIKCARNWFDNPYFVGGGSQQGGQQFPVNQRGQGTYTLSSGSYGIDRWGSFDVGSKHTLNSYGVLVETNGSNYALFAQRVFNLPKGIITISFLTGDVAPTNAVRIYLKFSDNTNDYYDCSSLGQNDLGYHTFTVSKTVTEVRFYTNASGSKFSLQAAKAEPGDTQTLAHRENGAWVLNEIPDYETELQKCRFYFERIDGSFAHVGNGFVGGQNLAYIWGAVSPKASQIENTNISLNGTVYIWTPGAIGGSGSPSTSIADGRCSKNGIFFLAFNAANSLTVGNPAGAQIRDASTYIDFSAEP